VAARSFVTAFLADRRGATAIEYGLICSLIFLAIVTAMTSFGNNTSSMIIRIGNAIGTATS
jgi:pilus assembly protein Flp/PilA